MSYYEKEQARMLRLLAEYEAEEEDGGELLSSEESDADENVSEQDVQCDMDIEEEISVKNRTDYLHSNRNSDSFENDVDPDSSEPFEDNGSESKLSECNISSDSNFDEETFGILLEKELSSLVVDDTAEQPEIKCIKKKSSKRDKSGKLFREDTATTNNTLYGESKTSASSDLSPKPKCSDAKRKTMSDPKKRRVERSKDPEVWLRWFDDMSSDEDSSIIGESDEDEVDAIQRSDHDTESELEVSDQEALSDDSSEAPLSNFYIGKDKVTKWKKTRPNRQVRVRSHNIVKFSPGTKGRARDVATEIKSLKLFVNETVIRMITVSTNVYIQKVSVSYKMSKCFFAVMASSRGKRLVELCELNHRTSPKKQKLTCPLKLRENNVTARQSVPDAPLNIKFFGIMSMPIDILEYAIISDQHSDFPVQVSFPSASDENITNSNQVLSEAEATSIIENNTKKDQESFIIEGNEDQRTKP
ncbi:hypothetical protein RN001_003444 [Aquatica leii]|uniref:Uncharacterized protein n=1 Tax=Aquatica leii TaxID=1421715 RepID=A0AAN7SRL2_9COLE|nr:hypothetical protein RN001_003444 [Aquatica leii]